MIHTIRVGELSDIVFCFFYVLEQELEKSLEKTQCESPVKPQQVKNEQQWVRICILAYFVFSPILLISVATLSLFLLFAASVARLVQFNHFSLIAII